MDYIGSVVTSMVVTVSVVFAIAAVGYLLGSVKIKGISLGTAGVLLVALAYGVLAHFLPAHAVGEEMVHSFFVGGHEIVLFSSAVKAQYNLVANIGTATFVTAVGLIAGPKFFRTFRKKSIAYILMGVVIIAVATVVAVAIIRLTGEDPSMIAGIMTGALTSTPGLSAAKEVAANADAATAGYGIAYLYGVLGVVLFVQLTPRLLKIDIAKERESFTAASAANVRPITRRLKQIEPLGLFPFFLTIAFGYILGSVRIPGINFSLGASGGTLVAGLIIGHFGHIGPIQCSVPKQTLTFLRELGLVLFLIGAGVPGGVNFVSNIKLTYFLYGVILTTVPMLVGFLLARYGFKLSIFNNLGSITGGMTSTPALGALISTAGTDEVASAYAATYPVALVCVVLAVKFILLLT